MTSRVWTCGTHFYVKHELGLARDLQMGQGHIIAARSHHIMIQIITAHFVDLEATQPADQTNKQSPPKPHKTQTNEKQTAEDRGRREITVSRWAGPVSCDLVEQSGLHMGENGGQSGQDTLGKKSEGARLPQGDEGRR